MNFNSKQHICKKHEKDCYCREMCCCENNFSNIKGIPNREFVKYRTNTGNLKPQAERIHWSYSRSNSKCSNQTILLSNDCNNSMPMSNHSTSSLSCTADFTARRELYERGIENCNPIKNWTYPVPDIDLISNDTINALNEFRIKNADSCLSFMSKYSLRQRLSILNKQTTEHICEYPFHINGRGLLETTTDKNGFALCTICEKPSKCPTEKAFVPIVTLSNQSTLNANRKHLEMCNLSNLFANQKQRREIVDTIKPLNSLALEYQTTKLDIE